MQDCLQICCNILQGEPCQRFFFGMGTAWPLRLAYFFDPALLENIYDEEEEEPTQPSPKEWFKKTGAVACATLAFAALAAALRPSHRAHQDMLGVSLTGLIPAAAFCIARNGPAPMVNGSLALLEAMVHNNAAVAQAFSEATLKVSPPILGETIPADLDSNSMPQLRFGWKPLATDDLTFVTVPALLVERYVFGGVLWGSAAEHLSPNHLLAADAALDDLSFRRRCLAALETYFAANPMGCDLLVQHVVAPPFPIPDVDDSFSAQIEAMPGAEQSRPLGALLLGLIVRSCGRVLGSDKDQLENVNASEEEAACTERAANVLSLVFIHGGPLARELCTAITLGRVYSSAGVSTAEQEGLPLAQQPLLPFLLSSAARAARSRQYPLVAALLRVLAAVVSGSEAAARQLLQDPTNLFVVGLASIEAERSGVPGLVQVASCLFLGACFTALPPASAEEASAKEGAGQLTRLTFLKMIEQQVSLARFSDTLRKPLDNSTVAGARSGVLKADPGLFFCSAFQRFYQEQVEAIRAGIFAFYGAAGGLGGAPASADEDPQMAVIALQKQRIEQLEAAVRNATAKDNHGIDSDVAAAKRALRDTANESALIIAQLQAEAAAVAAAEESHARELAAAKSALEDAELRASNAEHAYRQLLDKSAAAANADSSAAQQLQLSQAQALKDVQLLQQQLQEAKAALLDSDRLQGVLEEEVISLRRQLADVKRDGDATHAEGVKMQRELSRSQQSYEKLERELGAALTEAAEARRSAQEAGDAHRRDHSNIAAALASAQTELAAARNAAIASEERARKAEADAKAKVKAAETVGPTVASRGTLRAQGSPFDAPHIEHAAPANGGEHAAELLALRNEVMQLRLDSQQLKSVRNALQAEQAEVARLSHELSKADDMLQAEGELVESLRKQGADSVQTASLLQEKVLHSEKALQESTEKLVKIEAALAKSHDDLQQARQESNENRLGTPVKEQQRSNGTPVKLHGTIGAMGSGPEGFLSPIAGPSMAAGSRTLEAAALLESTPRQQRQIAMLTAQVAKERRTLSQLQEAHNDLLALLAQEEVELGVFRDVLTERAGEGAVNDAFSRAQLAVTERYGTYVNMRETADDGDW